ncbi:MAG: SH3 domain-containing protein [Pseudomonadota bacterium]
MKRLILLTFGFLGWAFYELSGGSDFESASDRQARLNPAPEVVVTEVADSQEAQTTETQTAEVVDTDPPQTTEVSRVSLNLTTLQDTVEAANDALEEVSTPEVVANIDPDTGVAINTTSSADTPAIIPSLILPNDTGAPLTQNEEVASVAGDIRTVTGDRVNVRGGPGTDFGVVFRLLEGDAVEVLEDNGSGWVRMRSVSGGDEGWMADWLLTAG